MGKTFFRAKQRVLVLENSQPVHQARQRQYQRQLPLVTLYGIRPVSIILTINIHFDLQQQESTVGAEYPKEGSYWKNSVVSAQQLSTMLSSFWAKSICEQDAEATQVECCAYTLWHSKSTTAHKHRKTTPKKSSRSWSIRISCKTSKRWIKKMVKLIF